MPTTLPISRLVNVTVNLSPLAAQAQSLSDLLILGDSNVIDVVQRRRTYKTLAEVAADFGTSAVEYLASVLWFEQAPQPTQVQIGRWAKTATNGLLQGAVVSALNQLISSWTAITTGAFFVGIDGIPKSINGLNFSAATNLNGIASTIQTALNTASTGSTCIWDANTQSFIIQSGTTGSGSGVTYLETPTATGGVTFLANPSAGDTVSFGATSASSTIVTFVSGAATAFQVSRVTGSVTASVGNLLTYLQGSNDPNLSSITYSQATVGGNQVLELKATSLGAGGNLITIAASAAAVSGATLSGGQGIDISTMLAMSSTSSGAYPAAGIDAETAVSAVALFDTNFGQSWYGLNIPEAVDSDHLAVAAFIEGATNKHVYGVSTTEPGVVSSVSTTDIAYLLSALHYKRTMVQYSSTNAYSACSLMGRALTVDYNGNSTVITLMYKQEPGIVAENLTETMVDALETKNCNVFVVYNNNTAIIEQGKVSAGDFIDEITGTDALAVDLQISIYNQLYTSPTKIPQTDAGTHLLVVTCEAVCSQFAINGLLGPGVWNSNGFGTLKSGDFLPKGFYVYAPPVASQFQADREARKSVPIQIAAKLSGAIHTVDIAITVNR